MTAIEGKRSTHSARSIIWTEPALRSAIKGTRVRCSAHVIGQRGGFIATVRFSDKRHGGRSVSLTNVHGRVRIFPNLTTLATVLRAIGLPKFRIDATHYVKGRVRAPRPDRARALRERQ